VARFGGKEDTLGRRVFVRMAHATEEDEELGRGKERGRGSNSVFKGQMRKREEAMAGYWPSMAEGAPAAHCLQEGEGD
jgi:hypothetical protein